MFLHTKCAKFVPGQRPGHAPLCTTLLPFAAIVVLPPAEDIENGFEKNANSMEGPDYRMSWDEIGDSVTFYGRGPKGSKALIEDHPKSRSTQAPTQTRLMGNKPTIPETTCPAVVNKLTQPVNWHVVSGTIFCGFTRGSWNTPLRGFRNVTPSPTQTWCGFREP